MKRVVIPARHGSRNQAGMFSKKAIDLWSEGTVNMPHKRNPMEAQIRTLTPSELLGPLNVCERKYAPSKLFSAGPMEIPLPRPRVSIIGSRTVSAKGLVSAANIARVLSRRESVIV